MTTKAVYKCINDECNRIFGCWQGRQAHCDRCESPCHMICTETVSGGICPDCLKHKLTMLTLRRMARAT